MGTKAAKKPINQPVVFFAQVLGSTDPQYIELFHCPADRHTVNAIEHFVGPDGRVYCTKACYDETTMIEEVTA